MNVTNESIEFTDEELQTRLEACQRADKGMKIARMIGIIQKHQVKENTQMYEFILHSRATGIEFKFWSLGKTRDDARTRLLIYNLAETDLTVWELKG